MTAPQQPGPSFEPPAYPPPGQQWQGPPGLPPQDKSAPRRGPRPIIILVSAVLAVALLISAGMMIGRELLTGDGAVSATEDATAISGQLLPPNATDGHGILIGGVAPSEDLPHVIIWEDPQCPACAHYENSFGPVIAELVAAGELTAEARFAYFLDREEADGPSLRAAIAMAAADDAGFFDEYHAIVFEHAAKGVGPYTDADLLEFASLAGVEDLPRFQQLYAARAYADFVANSYAKFTDDEILATPTFVVSGKRLRFYDEASNQDLIHAEPGSFLGAVREAWEAGGRQIEAPPEPR